MYEFRERRNFFQLGEPRSGLPWWLSGKESACNAGDPSLIPRSGRTPGEGNGTLLQDSCLGNPTDRGTWDHKESDTTEQLTHTHF